MSKRHYTVLATLCWACVVLFSSLMVVGLVFPKHNIVQDYFMCLYATISQAVCAVYWTKARGR